LSWEQGGRCFPEDDHALTARDQQSAPSRFLPVSVRPFLERAALSISCNKLLLISFLIAFYVLSPNVEIITHASCAVCFGFKSRTGDAEFSCFFSVHPEKRRHNAPYITSRPLPSKSLSVHYSLVCTRVGTLIVATIYLQLIQNRYMFRSFTVLHCSHQHCVQPVASDVEVVGYL